MAHRVFVYGTLKRGFPNHALMQGATFIGEATTRLAYPMMLQGQYFSVVMLPEPGRGHRIEGEVWAVDDAKLAALDALEATHLPTGYVRETIEVKCSGTNCTAWVYFKPRERIAVFQSEPHANYQDRRYVPLSQRSG